MPTLSQLEYLVAVDKFRHFGKAARACHVSQPSLSMQLKKAEEELGVVVFDRDKKPILPTEKGIAVIQQARVVLREAERLKQISQHEKGEIKGSFRLGVIPTIAPYVVPLFLDSWANRYPKVKLRIDEMKTIDIVAAIEDDQLDCGLLVTPLEESQIVEQVLFYEPFYLYVAKKHPLYKKNKVKDSDLDGNEIWLLEEGHCFRNQILKICSMSHRQGVYRNVFFESGNLETLKQLVQHNNGYTLLPFLATAFMQDSESKKMLKPFDAPIPTREVSLVYRRGSLKEDIIDALSAEIKNVIPATLKLNPNKNIAIIGIS